MAISMKAKTVMKAKRIAPANSKMVKVMNGKNAKAKLVKGKIAKIAKAGKTNKQLDEKQIQNQRKVELQAMKLAELEPLHVSKGLAAASVKEFAAKAKGEFLSKQLAELKDACWNKSLLVGGSKEDLAKRLVEASKEELRISMIEDIVRQEAGDREAARLKEAKVREVMAKMKKEKSTLSVQELKDALLQKALKTGGAKTEMINRLVARAREEGEVDRAVVCLEREAKREELLSMNKDALIELCAKSGVDPVAKEIMVDRLLLKL
jgi:hypothetical protein